MLMGTGLTGAIIAFILLGLLYVPQLATISATFPALFPTPVRFAGFAIAYNVSTSIFGGTAPAIGSALIAWTGDQLMPAYYMIFACLIGLAALRFMPETAGRSLRGDQIGSANVCLQSLRRTSDAVLCLNKQKLQYTTQSETNTQHINNHK